MDQGARQIMTLMELGKEHYMGFNILLPNGSLFMTLEEANYFPQSCDKKNWRGQEEQEQFGSQ